MEIHCLIEVESPAEADAVGVESKLTAREEIGSWQFEFEVPIFVVETENTAARPHVSGNARVDRIEQVVIAPV